MIDKTNNNSEKHRIPIFTICSNISNCTLSIFKIRVERKNTDIQILIEGHTDNVPMNPKDAIKDNWDLSALRATSIVKILTKNKQIDPTRITAAGRGEFLPIASNDNPDGKRKNRRTEIILTPNLDELFRILESN